MKDIEQKLDAPAASVDMRFDLVDARFDALECSIHTRFDEVTSALVEQRQYSRSMFERLQAQMKDGFATVDANLGRVELKVDRLIDRLLCPSES